jgi:hypothetical protein
MKKLFNEIICTFFHPRLRAAKIGDRWFARCVKCTPYLFSRERLKKIGII